MNCFEKLEQFQFVEEKSRDRAEEIMNEECLICKAPLTYLEADILMECEICHKKENSKTRCVNGHYVCNECHTRGLDRIIALCMTSASRDPIAIIEQMMALPTCHMHGPEHHVMVSELSWLWETLGIALVAAAVCMACAALIGKAAKKKLSKRVLAVIGAAAFVGAILAVILIARTPMPL